MLFWSIGGKYSIRRWRQMFRLTAKNFFCGMVHSGESTVLWSECLRSRILIPGVSGTEILFTQHSSYEKKSNIYKQKEIWLWHLNNRRLTKSFYGNSVISFELLSFIPQGHSSILTYHGENLRIRTRVSRNLVWVSHWY